MTEDKLPDFEKITDFGNLYQAYKRSKAGKGYSNSSMKFQLSALDGIYRLKHSLENKTYEISPYNQFTVYEPKERIIKACSFQDKIVQHSLCDNVLLPNLKDEFIYDNYAGQIGKGTLFGLNRLSEQMLQAYNKCGMDCWNIKADISKFFYSIDRDILKDIVRYHINDNDVYWLCERFIDSTDGVGIPLGNQVSQVFALLYLSGLDHFLKDELGIKYYGRYMDDFYILGLTKDLAKEYLGYIDDFISSLNLTFNGKTQIIPFKNGIKFCGFHTYVTKEGKVIRKLKNENKRAAKKNFKKLAELVCQGELSKEKFYQRYNAWKNHISHGNCYKLGVEMDKCVEEWLKGDEL